MRLNEFTEPTSSTQLSEEDMHKIADQTVNGNWVEFTDMDQMSAWLKSLVESKGSESK